MVPMKKGPAIQIAIVVVIAVFLLLAVWTQLRHLPGVG